MHLMMIETEFSPTEALGQKGMGNYSSSGRRHGLKNGIGSLRVLKRSLLRLCENAAKNSNILLNENGHNVLKEYFCGGACSAAFQISQLDMEFPDPFQPGLVCGKGKWPSFQPKILTAEFAGGKEIWPEARL